PKDIQRAVVYYFFKNRSRPIFDNFAKIFENFVIYFEHNRSHTREKILRPERTAFVNPYNSVGFGA
ncbi:MAG: hypothetical protein LBB88_09085, partial [Planctomycetaceae bacterium]|nr:hypothetical protein [Planctomycetaceae bacterium]